MEKNYTLNKMDTLSKLGLKYGTDKIGKHNYLPVYHEMFKDRRNEIRKVLEIGVGEWLGLKMWHDYFPNAYIYGADNEVNRLGHTEVAEVFRCDQSDLVQVKDLIYKTGFDLDLVIDDGSHISDHQLNTFLTIMPLLKDGAIYVIEDVSDSSIIEKIPEEHSPILLKVGKRYDDCLIICQK